ncbi:hypothetical protein R6Q59_009547 [Mikania micrantha]|uniref:Glycerophosphoryl diester phosphodiesterase membrane domain-containing protein n=1 Tax=Mikania micrantha TaxID=192012 RepID=A0A5N6N7M0_9ASTR|nr:hypothetical protein E3N88_26468 [Mikania micrantha]
MDRTHEAMKSIGFFGIFNQSFKTIFNSKKLFTQISLTLILPLTIIFLAHIQISNHFFWRVENNYLTYYYSTYHNVTVADWLYYWLFKIIYFTFLTVFSLLSTAAVVFTVASVYSDREITFRQVMKIVPNVWKKLFITFVFIYFALFIYNVIYGIVMFIFISIFGYSGSVVVLWFIVLILYVLGLLYLTVVWQLASVVTVLENIRGFNAMKKGKILANGKKMVGMGIAFVLYGILLGLIVVYQLFVEFGGEISGLAMIWRVMIGVSCGIVITMLFLMFIVTQTVLYLVCKSYHREAIDKLSLSTFLGAYTAETVVYPKPGEEIQLGRPQPPVPAQQV